MTRANRSALVRLTLLVVFLAIAVAPATAQQPQPPAQPFAPDWGMLAGFDVFSQKGCGKCHGIRGSGGGPGPDLGRIEGAKGFYDLGAAMWNHLPKMGAKMREARVDRPQLTPAEMSNLIAFLFTAQYWDELGNAQAGERVFKGKGCVSCHAVGGAGGSDGPPLDRLKRANSPVIVAAAMWNHGPQMAEAMKKKAIDRPAFKGTEMVDMIAYIVSQAKDGGGETTQVVPGTPERGAKLFADKRCASCHAVGGSGPKVGPDLGRSGHHVSLTRFAGQMWNHGPAMWAKAKERGIEVPTLTGQEMADILAHLYTSHYFDRSANARRGEKLVRDRGCLGCHAVGGKGATAAGDFAKSTVVATPAGVVAGMWNHSGLMEASAERQQRPWPTLKPQELADISAYLTSLSRSRPPK